MNNTPELRPDFCPYQGLEPFTEADKDYFVGRDADTRLISSNLLGVPLSVLYGVSGVGKSSVLLAGVMPRLRKNPGLAVTVFRQWQGDQFAEQLKQEIAAAVKANARPETKLDQSLPFDEFLRQCNEALDGPVFLIFDQWEEYFLYHPTENNFDLELARAISRRDVTTHFLFAMREEELSKLDRFRTSIPNVLGNMLRLKHLDPEAAEAAIRKPLNVYNNRVPAARQVTIEDDLVNSLIEKSARRDEHEQRLTQSNGHAHEERQIATPVLQLLLTRLWDEEQRQNSTALRAATLERLGGAQNVVDAYFESVVEQLPTEQRNLAGRTFGYLVTPAGGKFAQTPATLARWAKEKNEAPVRQLLDGLAMRANVRILRKVVVAGRPDQYEIFHDVLGPSILKWQQRFEQEQEAAERERESQIELERARQFAAEQQKRVKLFRRGMFLFGALLLSMAVLTLFAFQQQAAAQKAQADAVEQRNFAESNSTKAKKAGDLLECESNGAKTARDIAKDAQTEAVKQRDLATAAKDKAIKLQQQQQFAVSRELAATSAGQLKLDPRGSLLLAIKAMRVKPTGEAENALRNAYLESRLDMPLFGHKEPVTSAAFSPDGKFIVTSSKDDTAIVWSAVTGQMIFQLRDHSSDVSSAAFSPDGKLIVTASWDKTALVWNASTDILLRQSDGHTDGVKLVGHEKGIRSAAFSPNSQLIVTASEDGTARIWNAYTGEQLKELNQLDGDRVAVLSAAFSPDGQRIVTLSKNGTAIIWDVATGSPSAELKVSDDPNPIDNGNAVFSPNGKLIVTSGYLNNTVVVWDVTTATPTRTVLSGHDRAVTSAAFGPDSKHIVTTSLDNTARIWNAVSSEQEQAALLTLTGHRSYLHSAAFSSDGQFIVTASDDNTARVWNATIDEPVAQIDSPEKIDDATFSPNGRFIIANSSGDTNIWHTASGIRVTWLDAQKTHLISNLSPDDKLIVTADDNTVDDKATVYIKDMITGQVVTRLAVGSDKPRLAVFSPDSQLVAISSENDTTSLWRTASGEKVFQPDGRQLLWPINAFSPDSKLIVTVSEDGTARVWNIANRKEVTQFRESGRAVFSPDGKFIFTANDDKPVRVWNVGTGQPLALFDRHQGNVNYAVFSPNSKLILTVGDDNPNHSRIWNVTTGQPITKLADRPDKWKLFFFDSSFFSPDSKLMVFFEQPQNKDQSWKAHFWDAASGLDVSQLNGAKTASFSPDGRFIVTTNENKSVRIHPRTAFLPISELMKMANRLWPEGLTKEKRERYLPHAKPQTTTAHKPKKK